MATAYTSLLGLALPVTGELSGTWGATVNDEITALLDSAVAGTTSITADADITLSDTDGAANETRQAVILWNPATGTTTRNITAPARSKAYIVINASGGTQSIVLRGAGPTTGVTIVKGESAVCAWNGSDFVKVANQNGIGNFTTVDTTNLEVTNLKALDGTAAGSIANSTGVVTLASSVLTTTDINGGTIDGTAIGGSTAAAGAFTTLSSTGNTTLGDASADTVTVNGTTTFNASPIISVTDNTNAALRITQLGTGNALLVEDSSNPDSTPFVITASGDVGIGTSSPSSFNASGLPLVVGSGSGNTGMTIYSGTAASGSIHFADGTTTTDSYRGIVAYSHTSNYMTLWTDATERLRIDSSGNVGIGSSATNRLSLTYDGVGGVATIGPNSSSGNTSLTLGTSSAGTYVDRLTISSAGNVGIGAANNAYNFVTANDNTATGASQYSIGATATLSGTTFSGSFLSQLRIAASTTAASAAGLRIVNPSLASGASITNNYGIYIDDQTSGTNDYGIRSLVSSGTNKFNLYIDGTADNYFAGNVLVGTTSAGVGGLSVSNSKNINFAESATTALATLFRQSNSAALTLNYGYGYTTTSDAWASSIGTATARSSIAVGAGTIQFYTNTSSTVAVGTNITPTVRMTIDSSGNLLVGKTGGSISAVGCQIEPDGLGVFTADGAIGLLINRLTSDGDLVSFRQAGTQEGSISVSGTTVSYNGGHLSRWAQTTTAKDESLVKGTVLSNLDEMNVYTDAEGNPVENEQLNKVKVSDVEGDANVAGVFVNWTHDDAHNVDEINMAMTGDMIIRIAQGVTVARGDLLMSAGDGTAKPQGDDIVRSKTVAKVTSTHVTCTYADGSYCVPCVLMAC